MSYIGAMNLKILFVMSLLALSTLAIAAHEPAEDDIEAQIAEAAENAAGVRLLALSER